MARTRATRGAGARSTFSRTHRWIARTATWSSFPATRSLLRSEAGKWTIGGAPSRSASETTRPLASVASMESPRSPNVTSAAVRSKSGSRRARMANRPLLLPAPGSPIKAQTGPGRSTNRRALRKFTARISRRSVLTVPRHSRSFAHGGGRRSITAGIPAGERGPRPGVPGRASGSGGALLLVPRRRRVEHLEVCHHAGPGRLRLVGEPLDPIDLPVLEQHRENDLIVVDPEVVDAGLRDPNRLLSELRNLEAGHGEARDLTVDGHHHVRRRHLEGCIAERPIEHVVEVLVGRDPGGQLLDERVAGVDAGVPMRDAGREL